MEGPLSPAGKGCDAVGYSRLMGQDEAEDVDVTVKHGVGQRWSLMGPFETIDLNTPDSLGERAAWRDPRLMALLAHKARADREHGG